MRVLSLYLCVITICITSCTTEGEQFIGNHKTLLSHKVHLNKSDQYHNMALQMFGEKPIINDKVYYDLEPFIVRIYQTQDKKNLMGNAETTISINNGSKLERKKVNLSISNIRIEKDTLRFLIEKGLGSNMNSILYWKEDSLFLGIENSNYKKRNSKKLNPLYIKHNKTMNIFLTRKEEENLNHLKEEFYLAQIEQFQRDLQEKNGYKEKKILTNTISHLKKEVNH